MAAIGERPSDGTLASKCFGVYVEQYVVEHTMLLANKAANDENKSVDARRQFIYLERDSLTDCWRQSITDIRNRATRTANDCWKSSNSISTINVAKKPGLRLFRNQVDRDWAVRSECKSQQLSSPTETTSRDAETRNIETRH